MFLLKKVEHDDRFVAKGGREASYTRDINAVKFFPTREAADRRACERGMK